MIEVNPHLHIPYHELEFSFTRSSGPGGQHVNTTNSCAILKWNVLDSQSVRPEDRDLILLKLKNRINAEGFLSVQSQSFRDQDRNKSECMKKLAELLRQALFRPKKRVKTKPKRSAIEKRLKTKKMHSEKKRWRQGEY